MNTSNQLKMIGAKIRQLRREKDLTQIELSKACGIDQTGISKMEQGHKHWVTQKNIKKVAKALGTTSTTLGTVQPLLPESIPLPASHGSPLFDILPLISRISSLKDKLGALTESEFSSLIEMQKRYLETIPGSIIAWHILQLRKTKRDEPQASLKQ